MFWIISISTCYNSHIGSSLNIAVHYLGAPQLAKQYMWVCLLNQMADRGPKMHPTYSAHLRANTAKMVCRWHEGRNGRITKDRRPKETSLAAPSFPWTTGFHRGTAARTVLSPEPQWGSVSLCRFNSPAKKNSEAHGVRGGCWGAHKMLKKRDRYGNLLIPYEPSEESLTVRRTLSRFCIARGIYDNKWDAMLFCPIFISTSQ